MMKDSHGHEIQVYLEQYIQKESVPWHFMVKLLQSKEEKGES